METVILLVTFSLRLLTLGEGEVLGKVGEGKRKYVVKIRIRRSKRGLLLGKEGKEGEKERSVLFCFVLFYLFLGRGEGGF